MAISLPLLAQTTAAPQTALPNDPQAILAAAAPFYNFSSPEMKPWHLKASYQLYKPNGKPGEQGTFEYWWASPQVYRTAWTRKDATHSDWNMAGDKSAYLETGQPINMFENGLRTALLQPLPSADETSPKRYRLYRKLMKSSGNEFPCITVVPRRPGEENQGTAPPGLFPTYCFDSKLPVLLASGYIGMLSTEYRQIVKYQNRILPKEIEVDEEGRKILTAHVDGIDSIAPTDPALTPPADARVDTAEVPSVPPDASITKLLYADSHPSNISPRRIPIQRGGITVGRLVKEVPPIYPAAAKMQGIYGRVELQALPAIG